MIDKWKEFHVLTNASSSRLYCYAQKHVKSIRAVTKLPDTSMAKSFRSKSSRCKPPKPQTKTKPTSPYHVSDHKAAITVGVIMGVFLVCWVPFFCVNIVAAYCKTCISHRAFQVRLFIQTASKVFRFILNVLFIRNRFFSLLKKRKRKYSFLFWTSSRLVKISNAKNGCWSI